MTRQSVAVVIPTLREAKSIAGAVQSAIRAGASEVIIADGGSDDETKALALQAGATRIVESEPGRGNQLCCGAQSATSQWLLFLHADAALGKECIEQIQQTSNSSDGTDGAVIWGAFEQSIDAPGRLFRALEKGNAARVRWQGVPFGDQAVFVRRDVYEQIGGFARVPLMEDVELANRLRKQSWPVLLPGPVRVDARRWQRRGVIRQTARNWIIQIAYQLGVSPERLRRWYR